MIKFKLYCGIDDVKPRIEYVSNFTFSCSYSSKGYDDVNLKINSNDYRFTEKILKRNGDSIETNLDLIMLQLCKFKNDLIVIKVIMDDFHDIDEITFQKIDS